MTFLERIQVLERLDRLIKRSATGSPKDLSARLCVSERTVYDLIKIMKDMDAPIYFCSIKNSYRYEYQVDLSIGFLPSVQNLDAIKGGKNQCRDQKAISLRNFRSEYLYI